MSAKPNKLTTPFKPGQACPCGTGKRYDGCHGTSGGQPKSDFKLRKFDGDPTGDSVNGCYMSATRDCSGKLSHEHYISEAILSQFDVLRGEGFPGKLDQLPEVPIKALTVRVLCERHNSMLSQLDAPAGLAFDQIRQTQNHLLKPVLNRKKERHFLIDGYAMEQWALKTLLAAHVGGIAKRNGKPTWGNLQLDVDAAVERLMAGRLQPPLGLYFHNDKRPTKVGVSFTTLAEGNALVGIRLQLVHLGFDCIVVPTKQKVKEQFYRPPASVYWNKNNFTGILHIAWDGIKRGDDIYMEELD